MHYLARAVAFADLPGPWRWMPVVVIVLVMLWAGLDLRGYQFNNEVEWLEDRPGVRFGQFGRVETDPFLSREQAAALNQSGYTLELALEPSPDLHDEFGVLASFHNGDEGSQLIIGQWRHFLIVMNGDDFSHRRRLPRVSADISKLSKGTLLLTINSTSNGTSLHLNGQAVATNAKWQLTLPTKPEPGRLTLGNSVSASQPWRGVVTSFSLLSRPLASSEVEMRWRTRDQSFDSSTEALLLYKFEEAGRSTIRNHGSLAAPLTIPPRLYAIGPRFLRGSMAASTPGESLTLDSVVNFIGFIPFGMSVANLLRASRRSLSRTILIAAVFGFLLSLSIELAQAWMPSRDSSLRDLLLNTAGTPLGAWLWLTARARLKHFQSK